MEFDCCVGSRRVKIRINAAACTGHGRCYILAPEIFQPDDQGHSVALFTEPPDDLRDKAGLAVDNCPEHAILVVEDSSEDDR
jgi:ferredoxin